MGPGATIPNYTSNPLNGSDFAFLDINVVAPTPSPITTIPASLATFTTIPEASANITRTLTFTSAGAMGNLVGPFLINGAEFDMATINYTVPLNNTEIWTLTNQTPIAHPFHIHDVQFFILDINGVPPPPALSGYNDVVLVPAGMGEVRFIAKFENFANDTIPYMYHCHMLTHEDMGMMGQFIVSDPFSGLEEQSASSFQLYPNPTNGELFIATMAGETNFETYEIFDYQGKQMQAGELSGSTTKLSFEASNGMYWIKLANKEKKVALKRFTIK
jgi:bilirubin oxidase